MSHKVATFSYLQGSGGTLQPNALQANLCPNGVEHGADGTCEGFISGLPTAYRTAPGLRNIYLPGPYNLQPFQYVYDPKVPCAKGTAPYPGGFVDSCRPTGIDYGLPLLDSFYSKTLPSARYPYTSGQYSYTY